MFEESQSDGLIPCKPCKIPILRAQFYSNDLSNLIVELSNVKDTLRMPTDSCRNFKKDTIYLSQITSEIK